MPKERFFDIIARKGFPTRRARFCCEVLKEYKILDSAIQGIRRSESTKRAWIVDVDVLGKSGVGKCYRGTYHPRLIDALYDMIVKLKEEGVI